jgi:electron transfer flavoprotein-quinone oxidoreductase
VRPEELVADLKAHPAIAPLVRDGELKEYAAHLIPEGGYHEIPQLHDDGFLVTGDAAGLTLAAGIWLEGVNFAIGSGLAAGRAAADAVSRGDTSRRGLSAYRKELRKTFVLQDHKRLRHAPDLVMSPRVQQRYPGMMADVVEGLFTVVNPAPKPAWSQLLRHAAKGNGVRLRDLVVDAAKGARAFR